MSTQENLIKKWAVAPTVKLPNKKELFEMSDTVSAFDKEAKTIMAEARRDLSVESVKSAKDQIQDEYFWYFEGSASSVDKNVTGSPHRLRKSLFDVYRSYYLELRKLERQIRPFLHTSTNEGPAEPKKPEFEGIYLGKDIGNALPVEFSY